MFRLFGGVTLLAAGALVITSAGAQEGEKDKRKFKGDPAKFAEAVFKKLDANGDKKLSKDEFLKMAERAKDAVKGEKFKEVLTKVYEKADPDMKGLSLDQFKEVQKSLFEKAKDFKKKKDDGQ